MTDQRVAITGLGVVSPVGIGIADLWSHSLAGKSRVRTLTRFDPSGYACRVAGEIEDFDPARFVPAKVIKQTDRSTQMAIACCALALHDAKLCLDREDPDDVGMYFANVFGGMEFAEPELYAQWFLGPERVSAYQAIAWFYAATQGQWSLASGIRGFAKSIVADRAGGLQALAWSALAIRRGHCRVAFVGGFEAPLAPYVFLIHQTSGLLTTYLGDPAEAYRPFDRARSGLVLAEGSGILVLEEWEHAVARGAHIYAEVAGSATTFDPAPHPESSCQKLAGCFEQALLAANVRREEVDYVCADGAASECGDSAELAAIAAATQHHSGPLVSAPKSLMGHSLAAAGAIDAVWTCLMLEHQTVLPTVNLVDPDGANGLSLVRGAPRQANVDVAMCCGRGYDGVNTAVVLRRPAA